MSDRNDNYADTMKDELYIYFFKNSSDSGLSEKLRAYKIINVTTMAKKHSQLPRECKRLFFDDS